MALHTFRRIGRRAAQAAAIAAPVAAALYAGYRWQNPRGETSRTGPLPQEMTLNRDQQLSSASLDILRRIENGEL